MNPLCDDCQETTAQVVCLCQVPQFQYCGQCFSAHQRKDSVAHQYISVVGKGAYKQRIEARAQAAQVEFLANFARAEEYMREVTEGVERLIRELRDFRERTRQEIERWKEQMQVELKAAEVDMRSFLSENSQQLSSELALALYHYSPGSLQLLSVRCSFEAVSALIPSLAVITATSPAQVFDLCAISATPRVLFSFNFPTCQWQPYMTLRRDIVVDDDSNYLFLARNRVFICGGVRADSNFNYILDHGQVNSLPFLLVNRYHQGLYYEKSRDCVYVFGGDTEGNRHSASEPLKACERFRGLTGTWETIPDMTEPRRLFNPCFHRGLLYLCGGATRSIETFDLSTHVFTPVIGLILQPDNLIGICTTAVSVHSELVVVSSKFLCGFTTETGSERRVQHENYGTYSHCAPVVYKTNLYVVYGNLCRGVDWTTGEKKVEVSGFNSR